MLLTAGEHRAANRIQHRQYNPLIGNFMVYLFSIYLFTLQTNLQISSWNEVPRRTLHVGTYQEVPTVPNIILSARERGPTVGQHLPNIPPLLSSLLADSYFKNQFKLKPVISALSLQAGSSALSLQMGSSAL